MTIDLSSLTNGKLIKELKKRDVWVSMASDAIYACEDRMDIPFRDIVSKLGSEHPQVVYYETARRGLAEAKYEAQRRVGPVQFDMTSTYIIYLENQKSRRKAG